MATDGYRWYLKRQETLSDYQGLLDDLVAAGALDVAQSVEAAGSLRTPGHLQSEAIHGVSRSQNKSKIISKIETYKF